MRDHALLLVSCSTILLLVSRVTLVQSQLNISDHSGRLKISLFRTLFDDYQSCLRPVCGDVPLETTAVVISFSLRQIRDVDETKQILTTDLWLKLVWSECRLTWNSSLWNASRLTIPSDLIWTPDIFLYDNTESSYRTLQSQRVCITPEGSVTQLIPLVIKSVCQLDLSRFPFDTQTCSLTFSSWIYSGKELNLTASENAADTTAFIGSSEWEVVNHTVSRVESSFHGILFPQVIFTVVLRRQYLFYVISLLFPCALIQWITVLAFLLPFESNEKVSYEITVLLSLVFLQLAILSWLPASSETVPFIGVYFTLAMILVSLSCAMTVMVQAVYYPYHFRPLPSWARALLVGAVGKLLCIDPRAVQTNKNPDCQENAVDTKKNNATSCRDAYRLQSLPQLPLPPLPPEHELYHHNQPTGKLSKCDKGILSIISLDDDFSTTLITPKHTTANIATSGKTTPHDIKDTNLLHIGENRPEVNCLVLRKRETKANLLFKRTLRSKSASVTVPLSCPRQQKHQQDAVGCNQDFKGVVALCQKILDCMRNGQKYGKKRKENSLSQKKVTGQWRTMAVFLDRVFLFVFCTLTLATFVYFYGSVA